MTPMIHRHHALRITAQGICAGYLGVSLMLTSTHAQEPEAEKPRHTPFPALDILPEGSILKGVRLPRYDKNFKPYALLTAQELVVLDSFRSQGKDIAIHLFHPDGKKRAHAQLSNAIYDHKFSRLTSQKKVLLTGEQFEAHGNGLIFNWGEDFTKGILLGPVTTTFDRPPQPTAMHSSPLRLNGSKTNQKLSLTTALSSLFVTFSIAVPPVPPSQKQLDEMERQLNAPVHIATYVAATNDRLIQDKQASQIADQSLIPFLQLNQLTHLLVQAPGEQAKPNKPAAAEKKPAEKKPKAKNPTEISVKCKGGFYFDSDEGIFAYLKDIELKERRFTLNCNEVLKVFLSPNKKKEDPAAKAGPKTPPKKDTAKKKDESSLPSFGEIKRVLAKGGVTITSKDDKNRTFTAKAETCSYDAATGEIILRGGRPSLTYGPKNYIKAAEDNLWISIKKNGKIIAKPGAWNTAFSDQ